ncbi:MAG: DUF4340 domain-containing protein [Proteobacteria bacterium]|nr:DUF4340 domain-containing protein [Pseudomonadota bacterium]MBU1738255.1 DUF4340 domain-containing protein [Pseudomonadota bacterium]
MNNRNTILAGLLAVQLVLVVIMFWRSDDGALPETALLTGLRADAINTVQIADEDGGTLVMRRREKGWQVAIEKDVWYPADGDKVDSLVTKLATLNSSRLVTRTRASHGRLKVADQKFGRRLELAGDGKEPAVLYLGTAPNHKSIHVRVAGDDKVYLVKDLAAWEVQVDPGTWWRTSYLDLDPDRLTEIRLKNDKDSFVLIRRENKADWFLQGSSMPLNREKLNGFLEDVAQLSVTEIIPPSAAKPEGTPLAEITMKGDGRETELLIWDRKDENSDHPVKSSADPFYAMAGRYAVDELLNSVGIDLIDTGSSLETPKKK